jgi:hypothetical protein
MNETRGLPRRGSRGYELGDDEGSRHVPTLPLPVEQVTLHTPVCLVDGRLRALPFQQCPPVSLSPAHAERVPRSLSIEQRHHPGEIPLPVGPDALLLGTGGQVRGLEAVTYGFGGEFPAVAAVEGVGEGMEH